MSTKSLFAVLLLFAVGPALRAQTTTFTWGSPTTGTWENGVAFGVGGNYVNNLSATGSIAEFGNLSDPTTVTVNGAVEAYQLQHTSPRTVTLNAGTGDAMVRLGVGGILQTQNNSAVNIGTGIEVTTGQAWALRQNNTFSGVISGSGNLAITVTDGRGLTWTSAANTYSGTITVTAGQLFTDKSTGFQFATLDTTGISSSTGFRFSQTNNTIGSLQGSGNLQLARRNGSVDTNDRGGLTLTLGNNNSSTTFSGDLTQGAAASSIIKIGSGTQTFSGANSYTGTTSVNEGTLLINGNSSAATGAVTVASGATLGGSGTIGGNTTVNAGGILTPGTSPGTLTFSQNLSLVGDAVVYFEGGDLINVGGDLSLSDSWTLSLQTGFQDGGSTTIFTYGSLTYSLGSLNPERINITGLGFTPSSSLYFTDTGSSIVLNGISVIPEPSTWALLVGSLAVLVVYRLRRRTA